MPKTTNLPNKAKLKWSGKELEASARRKIIEKLLLAVEYVRGKAVKNVSTSGRSNGPSQPGEFPHAITGRLRNSIFGDVDEQELSGVVGTNLKYGLWLEYGTRGGRVIEARGRALTWIGAGGVRVFARRVTIGPIAARSYLRRSFNESMPKLRQLFGESWGDLKAG